jgi:3-hydroxybutyryl-CoA dehydrogenase
MNIIGIIGEGKMGTNLFHYISDFPFEMRWITSPGADVEKIARTWSKKVARGLNAGIIDPPGADRRNRAVITKDPGAIADCDLIIEAVPERENLKSEIFRQADPIAKPGCIFASNSSSILPSRLSPSEFRKPYVIGMHFFYPVSLKNIVELVFHPGSDSMVVERSIRFLNTIQRKFLCQGEEDAFLLNRIYLEVQAEAWQIVREGLLTPMQVDHLVRTRLFPLGPFECMDVVGLDVMLPSIRNYIRRYPDTYRYQGLLNDLEKMVEKGRLGMKSGQGYFDHTEDASEKTGEDQFLPEEAAGTAVLRVKAALEKAVETLGSEASYPREDILEGLKEYFGD